MLNKAAGGRQLASEPALALQSTRPRFLVTYIFCLTSASFLVLIPLFLSSTQDLSGLKFCSASVITIASKMDASSDKDKSNQGLGSRVLLDKVDKLRELGISHLVPLPQVR